MRHKLLRIIDSNELQLDNYYCEVGGERAQLYCELIDLSLWVLSHSYYRGIVCIGIYSSCFFAINL